jgi:murein L,D-transpeptidase YafK
VRRKLVRGLLFGAVCAGLAAVLSPRGGSLQGGLEQAGESARDFQRLAFWALGWPLTGTPDLSRLEQRLAEKEVARGAPVFVRIFKREHELELWMRKKQSFVLFAVYPICRFSGRLGPKLRAGDHQAPEGFYTVSRGQLNPHSRWRRAFNVGYPNAFDRAHGRTGSYIMVHGGCSSIGCYAMTNRVIEEIWDLIVAALDNGQKRFAVHVFPFRMTDDRLARRASSSWIEFWSDLKRGYDLFEQTRVPPRVSVCRGRYVVSPGIAGGDGAESVRAVCQKAVHRRAQTPASAARGPGPAGALGDAG